jgi:hypothetical protein
MCVTESENPSAPKYALCALLANHAQAKADSYDVSTRRIGAKKYTLGTGRWNSVLFVKGAICRGQSKEGFAFKANDAGVIESDSMAESNAREIVHRGTQAMATLLQGKNGSGPNVVVKTWSASVDGTPGIGMERIDGCTLSKFRPPKGFWGSASYRKDATEIQIVDSLTANKDIHSGNVMVTPDGRLVRVDSDLAYSPWWCPQQTILSGNEGVTYGPCIPQVIDQDQADRVRAMNCEEIQRELTNSGFNDRRIADAILRIEKFQMAINSGEVHVIQPEQWDDSEILKDYGCTANNSYFQYLYLLHEAIPHRPEYVHRWIDVIRSLNVDMFYPACDSFRDTVAQLPEPKGIPQQGAFMDALQRVYVDGKFVLPNDIVEAENTMGALVRKDGERWQPGQVFRYRKNLYQVATTGYLRARQLNPQPIKLAGVGGETYVRGDAPGQANMTATGEFGIVGQKDSYEVGKIYQSRDGTYRRCGQEPGDFFRDGQSENYQIVPGGDLPAHRIDAKLGVPYRCLDGKFRMMGEVPGCVYWDGRKRSWHIVTASMDEAMPGAYFRLPNSGNFVLIGTRPGEHALYPDSRSPPRYHPKRIKRGDDVDIDEQGRPIFRL